MCRLEGRQLLIAAEAGQRRLAAQFPRRQADGLVLAAQEHHQPGIGRRG